MGLSFTIAAGSRQRSHSQVRVPRDLRPYFNVSDSRFPEPRGPGPRIYIPQEHGGPVIPPGTGFPFRRLLRLGGLRWRYSTPPLHGLISLKLIWPLFKHSVPTSQKTHRMGWCSENALDLFSGDDQFDSWPGYRFFVAFPSQSKQMSG
jgi:hypothetical protein